MSEDREAIISAVLSRLENGEPLAQILRGDGMPARSTWYEWRDADAALAGRIARARDIGEDAIAESCIEIADDARNDYMEALDEEGGAAGWRFNGENSQRSKLRIWTRMELLKKWNPKKWGDKQQIEHSGSVSIAETLRAAREKRKGEG